MGRGVGEEGRLGHGGGVFGAGEAAVAGVEGAEGGLRGLEAGISCASHQDAQLQ